MFELNKLFYFIVSVAGSFLLGLLLRLFIKTISKSKKLRIKETLQVFFQSIARPMPFLFVVIGLKIGINFLTLSQSVFDLTSDIIAVLITISVTYFIYSFIDVVNHILSNLTVRTSTKLDDMMVPMVRKSLRVVVVVLGLVQVAQVLSDKPITSILAGLGVGGLAVALAAQETIKNFFGSLLIFSDKPFELDERIRVASYDGIVEEVGFRSTRIRTLEGHLVTIPNGELANQMIENIAKRPHIRRILELGITYDTSPEKIEEARMILSKILENHEGMDNDYPPRIYFKDFNASSLDLIVIYWYHPADYWGYMKFNDKVNTEILKQFNEAGIEFAFPTRTLHINQATS